MLDLPAAGFERLCQRLLREAGFVQVVAKSVTPAHVREFRGAMQGRADKGIILTTGTFTGEARREASRDGVLPIELVDGEKLLDMFEEYELGLRSVATFELDPRFFEEFR
jgi:restriction system protein